MTDKRTPMVLDTDLAQRIEICRLKRDLAQATAQGRRAQSAAIQMQAEQQMSRLGLEQKEADAESLKHAAELRALRVTAFGGTDVTEWDIDSNGTVTKDGKPVYPELAVEAKDAPAEGMAGSLEA